MSATSSPIVVSRMPAVADSPAAMRKLRDGLASVVAELGIPELRRVRSDEKWQDASVAFQRYVVDAVAEEIAPQVANLLRGAIARRLPWTWQPEPPRASHGRGEGHDFARRDSARAAERVDKPPVSA
jgi:hypothetical protein